MPRVLFLVIFAGEEANSHLDPNMATIGRENLDNVAELLDSQAIWPLTQRGGMTVEQFEELTRRARDEAGNLSYKLYIPV
jgi:hypothetical protein